MGEARGLFEIWGRRKKTISPTSVGMSLEHRRDKKKGVWGVAHSGARKKGGEAAPKRFALVKFRKKKGGGRKKNGNQSGVVPSLGRPGFPSEKTHG